MKKLMIIAAAMTIAAGAYADGCTPDTPDLDCSLVYKVKMTLKAGRPKTQKGKCDTVCYRTPTKLTLDGYAVACDVCDCAAFQEDLTWYLWSKKEKALYLDGEDAVEWGFLNVIGKKANELEGSFYMETYGFAGYGSGFGKMEKKFCIPQSMNGEFAGWGGVPPCTAGDVCNPGYENTWAYDCADYCEAGYDTDEGIDSELPTAYTGKWSMKYDKSGSKKYSAGKWTSKVPNYDYFAAGVDGDGPPGTEG